MPTSWQASSRRTTRSACWSRLRCLSCSRGCGYSCRGARAVGSTDPRAHNGRAMNWLLLCLALATTAAAAQYNGILLVAKPDLRDPNFRETVIAVTRAPDASTVGVILNRPLDKRLTE